MQKQIRKSFKLFGIPVGNILKLLVTELQPFIFYSLFFEGLELIVAYLVIEIGLLFIFEALKIGLAGESNSGKSLLRKFIFISFSGWIRVVVIAALNLLAQVAEVTGVFEAIINPSTALVLMIVNLVVLELYDFLFRYLRTGTYKTFSTPKYFKNQLEAAAIALFALIPIGGFCVFPAIVFTSTILTDGSSTQFGFSLLLTLVIGEIFMRLYAMRKNYISHTA